MKSKSFGFWFFGFCLLIMYFPAPSHPCLCLLLGSTFKCPEPPSCCESGYYALDECGCCMKCAKAELQKCGGASGISGRCGQGLQCLKTCFSCRTVGDSGLPCVFPFTYQNETYNKCTSRDSDTGQPWCATAVDEDGAVVDYAWGDCGEGCPGTNLECDEKYFSIQEGVCIDVSVPGAIPNWIGAPTVKLEPSTEVLFPAPVCKNKGARREYENTCRCDRGETALDFDIQGVPRGNCTGLDEDERDNLDKVWCFLENIRDPQDPRSGCYSDTRWSARDGRFWSALACTQDPDVNSSQDLLASAPTFTSNLGQNLPQVKSRPTPGPTRAPPTTAIASTTTVATTTVATTTESTTEHQTKIPEPAEPAEPAEHAEPAEPAEHARTTNLELQQKGLDDDIYDIVFNPQDSAEFDYEEYDAAVESENKAANSPDHSNGLESDYEEANLVREEDRTSGISRLDSELTRGTATRANFNFVHDDQEEEMEDEGLEEEKDGGPVDDHTDSIVSESENHFATFTTRGPAVSRTDWKQRPSNIDPRSRNPNVIPAGTVHTAKNRQSSHLVRNSRNKTTPAPTTSSNPVEISRSRAVEDAQFLQGEFGFSNIPVALNLFDEEIFQKITTQRPLKPETRARSPGLKSGETGQPAEQRPRHTPRGFKVSGPLKNSKFSPVLARVDTERTGPQSTAIHRMKMEPEYEDYYVYNDIESDRRSIEEQRRTVNGLQEPETRRTVNGLKEPETRRTLNGLQEPETRRTVNGLKEPETRRTLNGLQEPETRRTVNGLQEPETRPRQTGSPPNVFKNLPNKDEPKNRTGGSLRELNKTGSVFPGLTILLNDRFKNSSRVPTVLETTESSSTSSGPSRSSDESERVATVAYASSTLASTELPSLSAVVIGHQTHDPLPTATLSTSIPTTAFTTIFPMMTISEQDQTSKSSLTALAESVEMMPTSESDQTMDPTERLQTTDTTVSSSSIDSSATVATTFATSTTTVPTSPNTIPALTVPSLESDSTASLTVDLMASSVTTDPTDISTLALNSSNVTIDSTLSSLTTIAKPDIIRNLDSETRLTIVSSSLSTTGSTAGLNTADQSTNSSIIEDHTLNYKDVQPAIGTSNEINSLGSIKEELPNSSSISTLDVAPKVILEVQTNNTLSEDSINQTSLSETASFLFSASNATIALLKAASPSSTAKEASTSTKAIFLTSSTDKVESRAKATSFAEDTSSASITVFPTIQAAAPAVDTTAVQSASPITDTTAVQAADSSTNTTTVQASASSIDTTAVQAASPSTDTTAVQAAAFSTDTTAVQAAASSTNTTAIQAASPSTYTTAVQAAASSTNPTAVQAEAPSTDTSAVEAVAPSTYTTAPSMTASPNRSPEEDLRAAIQSGIVNLGIFGLWSTSTPQDVSSRPMPVFKPDNPGQKFN